MGITGEKLKWRYVYHSDLVDASRWRLLEIGFVYDYILLLC